MAKTVEEMELELIQLVHTKFGSQFNGEAFDVEIDSDGVNFYPHDTVKFEAVYGELRWEIEEYLKKQI